MPIIYQTARLPVVYKARMWSAANIFHVICTIIKFVAPILACVFYINNHSGNTFDTESAMVVPGNILYFNMIDEYENNVFYPPVAKSDFPSAYKLLIMTHPQYDRKNYLKSWKININVTNSTGIPRAISLAVLFNFTVKLRKYATNNIQSVGSFTRTFINGVNRVVCYGDLVFEQNEMIEFRGSFEGTDLPSMDISDYDSLTDIINARDDVSTLFYVDWDDPVYSFSDGHALQGTSDGFQLELVIRVKDFTIYHSIPLVSSFETFLILFLATYLLSALALDSLQGFVFRHGIIKSWVIPLYEKPKKISGAI